MSEIDAPSYIPLKTGEGATRVTPPATTSDDGSAQQQSPRHQAQAPEKHQDAKEKLATYETAVTLSPHLSSLEAGDRITAQYLGVDGQDRPLIASETGTYVVKYEPQFQDRIDRLPPHATLEVRISLVERQIEARLYYQDTAAKNPPPPISIPVTLDLVGLGNKLPKIKTPADPPLPSAEQHAYRATTLYQAEHIARESAHKLSELPLPTTSPRYTLYEKAIPQDTGNLRQGQHAIVQSTIAGNALIAQEQPQGISPPLPAAGVTPPNPLASHVEKLLHQNIPATIIKTFPQTVIDLPPHLQKHLERPAPLAGLPIGSIFPLRIDSFAIPDPRPEIRPKAPAVTVVQENRPAPTAITPIQPPAPSVTATSAPPPEQVFSGIIIAPGKDIVLEGPKPAEPAAMARQVPHSRHYPAGYTPAAKPKTTPASSGGSSGHTVYVATPLAVIKIMSPIALAPGTVINFSLPAPTAATVATAEAASPLPPNDMTQATVKPAPRLATGEYAATRDLVTATASSRAAADLPPVAEKASDARTNPENIAGKAGPDMPDAAKAAPGAAPPAAESAAPQPRPAAPLPPPQPLEHFIQNWQSLSQIVSLLPAAPGSPPGQAPGNRIPAGQSPGQLSSTMIFFMAALGAKNPAQTWLGPQLSQQLERAGQQNLMEMLNRDMQRIHRMGAETPPQEWRPALIPMQVGSEVTAIPVLTRQIPEEKPDRKDGGGDGDDAEEKNATRFIMELSLSQFGELQVDGLLKAKKLNIILRSKIMLPESMKREMSGLFTSALEASGYTGDLQFKDNSPPDISVQNILTRKIHLLQANRVDP